MLTRVNSTYPTLTHKVYHLKSYVDAFDTDGDLQMHMASVGAFDSISKLHAMQRSNLSMSRLKREIYANTPSN